MEIYRFYPGGGKAIGGVWFIPLAVFFFPRGIDVFASLRREGGSEGLHGLEARAVVGGALLAALHAERRVRFVAWASDGERANELLARSLLPGRVGIKGEAEKRREENKGKRRERERERERKRKQRGMLLQRSHCSVTSQEHCALVLCK